MSREIVATIDVETRSTCELKRHGGWVYSADPTTELLCICFRLPAWAPGRTGCWHPAYLHLGIQPASTKDLAELFDWIWAGKPVEAHNAAFERAIGENILVAREDWPVIQPWQFRCSAAKAAAHTLPRALGDVAAVLKLREQKDIEGSKLMTKLTKPRKPRKAEREAWTKLHGSAHHPTLWWEDKPMFERLWAYCAADVLAEARATARLSSPAR